MYGHLTPNDREQVARVLAQLEQTSGMRFVHAAASYVPIGDATEIDIRIAYVKGSPEDYLQVAPRHAPAHMRPVAPGIRVTTLELLNAVSDDLTPDRIGYATFMAQAAPYIDAAAAESLVEMSWFRDALRKTVEVGPTVRSGFEIMMRQIEEHFLNYYHEVAETAARGTDNVRESSVTAVPQPVAIGAAPPAPVARMEATPAARGTLAQCVAALAVGLKIRLREPIPAPADLRLPEGCELYGIRSPKDCFSATRLPTPGEVMEFCESLHSRYPAPIDTAKAMPALFGVFRQPETINEAQAMAARLNEHIPQVLRSAPPINGPSVARLAREVLVDGEFQGPPPAAPVVAATANASAVPAGIPVAEPAPQAPGESFSM